MASSTSLIRAFKLADIRLIAGDMQLTYNFLIPGALILLLALALAAGAWLIRKLSLLLPDPVHFDRELDFIPQPQAMDSATKRISKGGDSHTAVRKLKPISARLSLHPQR